MSAGVPADRPMGPSGRERLGAATAWVVWLAALGTSLLGLSYGIASQATPDPTLPQTAASLLAALAIAVTYASVGLLLRLRRPGIVIGWLFLGIGLVSGFGAIFWNYVWLSASSGSPAGPIDTLQAAMLNEVLVVPGWGILLFLLILLFPDGHLVDRAWRPVAAVAVVINLVFAVCLGLVPGPILFFPIYTNPYGPTGLGGQVATIVTTMATIGVVLCGLAAVWSMVVRYRRSDPVGRHQLKWLAWGSSLSVIGGIVLLTVASRSFDPRTNAADVSWLIFAVGSIALPISALIAILREGLYDIDQLIGRTFVYGALTAILAGVYAASIRLFNAAFVGLTGETSELALVLTTLVLATTFTPIKQRLEHVATSRLGSDRPVALAASGEIQALSDLPPGDAELDRRIEAIARLVSLEVLSGSRSPAGETPAAPGHPAGVLADPPADLSGGRPG